MGKIAIVISASDEYQPIWDITYPSTKSYCDKHNYDLIRVQTGVKPLNWERFHTIIHALPKYDWIFCRGVDMLVMNPEIKLEEFIDENYDFIITRDCHDLNSDAILIKNSDWSRDYLNYLYYDCFNQYKHDCWMEQRAIINSYKQYPDNIKVIPQKSLNSYHYPYYNRSENEIGQYTDGDLYIHFPGLSMKDRIEKMTAWTQK